MTELAKNIEWSQALAPRAAMMRASEVRELLKVLGQPGIISFAGGIPDPDLFPLETICVAFADILSDRSQGVQALQYSVSEGYPPLREWIASHMTELGVPCSVDNIAVTSGSQQALDFLGKLFVDEGDTVLVTAPTYLGALQAFNPYQPRYDRLDVTPDGTPAWTYRTRAETAGGRIAMAYAVPDFANPSGETMDAGARRHLLDLAASLDIPLIEDGAYRALRYEGVPLPSCLSLDVQRCGHIDRTRTVYCGTFSKTVSPGIRIGWICGARALVERAVLTKQAADLHSATINQMALTKVIGGGYGALITRLINAYAPRRDAMLAALDQFMPSGVAWTRPQGGMFIWVTLPSQLDGAALLAEALRSERLAFVPGGAFFFDGCGRNTIRLNFSLQPEPVIREGVRRLGELIRKQLSSAPRFALADGQQ